MKINPVLSTPAPSVGDVWDHLIPIGRFPAMASFPGEAEKKKIVQISTLENLQKLALSLNRKAEDENWPGILMDLEHQSEGDEGSTEAAAWYRDFEVHPDGLYGKAERTSMGQEKISGKNYKRLSPVAEVDPIPNREGEFMITGLRSVALTNKPNMRSLRILVNNHARGAASQEEFFEIEPITKESIMLTKDTLSLLGLTEDAEADAVNAKIVALNKRATESETKLTAIEADDFAKTNATRFEGGEETAKKLFVENRELAEGIVANAAKVVAKPIGEEDPETKPVVLNRENTKTPKGSVTAVGEDTESKAESEKYLRVQNRASEIVSKDKIPFNAAWNKALAEEK